MSFPQHRYRRLRGSEGIRRMVRETALAPDDFIHPLFVRPGHGERREVPSMPGVFQLSVDQVVPEVKASLDVGVPAFILFGIPAKKDATGTEGASPDGVVPQAIRAIREKAPSAVVIADLCFCEYTDHGHCGVIAERRGAPDVDNDRTLDLLGQAAVAYAKAGADVIAPSGMMDGFVRTTRAALDAAGHSDTAILAYSAKYASAFYGPFRDAAESPPKFGDRATYQMDPANAREALRETLADVDEGADMVMVKPALSYLDVIASVRAATNVPVAAYNVSGEYSMVKAAAARGWLDEKRTALEVLTSIKRAGADLILTYWARDAAKWIAG